jgi:hypothetical protein
MQTEKELMKVENILPEDFEGIFYFSNYSDEDFTGKWSNEEYLFPAHTMSPLVIPDASLLDIQQIRKKLAKDLAEREYYKGPQYKMLLKQERNDDGSPRLSSFLKAGTYSENDLVALIQMGLNPLPVKRATVKESTERPKLESTLSKDDEGRINTRVVKQGQGLQDLAKKFESE